MTLTDSDEIWIYAVNPTNPDCFAEASFTVTIYDTPIVDDPADVVACDSYELPVLNVGDYFDQPGGGGNAYSAGDVITAPAGLTLYVYAQTGTVPNCFTENSFTVGVFSSPVITAPTPLEVCDDNNDGFSCLFDLTSKNAEITGGAGLVVTYHETETDAENGVSPITDVLSYCNLVMGEQTLYVRVTDAGAPLCASLTTLVIRVNRVPVANPDIADYALCDVNNTGDGIEGFDLPSMDLEVLNGQTGITVTYYLNQADALAPASPINTAVLFNNTPGAPQEIWVRLENALTGCFGVGSFNLVVNPLPVVVDPAPMNACSDGTTGTASFNLSSNDPVITGGIQGLIVTYHLLLADAQDGVSPLPNPYVSGNQTIYVRVEDAATGCFDTTTLDLVVTQGPPVFTPSPLEVCDPDNDCFAGFDLTDAYDDVMGGPLPGGVVITFHETIEDAQAGVTPIDTDYTNIVQCLQTVFVRATFISTGCFNIVPLELIVHYTPQGTEIAPLEVCDDNTDGIGTFNLTLATPGILAGIADPSTVTLTYHLLEASAQAGTGPIISVLSFSSVSTTIYVRIEDNVTGCFDVIPLELIVNPLPVPPVGGAVTPYSLCDVNNPGDEKEEFDLSTKIPEILNGQTGMAVLFYLDITDALAGNNPLPNLYINATNAQTLVAVITNVDTGCFVTTLMDLRVEPLPMPIMPAEMVSVCDDDSDCFASFDLDELITDMLQNEPNVTITFHETEQQAQDGIEPITSPYNNIVPCQQFIYVRAENNLTGCFSVTMLEINVTNSPLMPPLEDLTRCDDDSNGQDGITGFDLSVQDAVVLAAQTGPASDYTVTYYISEAAAQAGTSPIISVTNYRNTLGNPQTIWVRVEDIATECFNIGSFDLIVNLPLALVHPAPLALCDDGPTTPIPQTVFDLTVKDLEITGGTTGYLVEYFATQADQLSGNPISPATAYTNTFNPQTIFVTVTGPGPTFCKSYETVTLRVLPLPVPMTDNIEPLELCDDNLPVGTEEFDLTENQDYIMDNDPSLVLEYYPTEADAIAQSNQILVPTAYETATTTIWIRVMKNSQVDYLGDFCYVLVQQEVIVNPLPAVATPLDYVICDPQIPNTGFAVFTLDSMNADVLGIDPAQVPADFTITYHLTQAGAQAGTNPLANSYTNLTNPQTVYVRVVNIATGCVNATGEMVLRVADGATATAPPDYFTCDDDLDGEFILDLPALFDATVLNGQNDVQFTVAYYENEQDALDGTDAIATPEAYTASTGTIYAVVTNTATGCASIPAAISITVEPLSDPQITTDALGSNSICVDWSGNTMLNALTLHSGMTDGSGYTFQWLLDGQPVPGAVLADHTITDVDGDGVYTVIATSGQGCVSAPSDPFTVVKSGPAEIPAGTLGYTISNAFSDNQTITVSIVGHGEGFYQYQLDDGPILDNGGIFGNIGPGEHTITVYDMEGIGTHCAELVIEGIMAINYPPYFTPNGDGFHDTWNIIGLDDSAKIYIFDRYGKLLKQISPTGEGWNGTYNGQLMPSTDYWFQVFYQETGAGKEFKAHFSLKR